MVFAWLSTLNPLALIIVAIVLVVLVNFLADFCPQAMGTLCQWISWIFMVVMIFFVIWRLANMRNTA